MPEDQLTQAQIQHHNKTILDLFSNVLDTNSSDCDLQKVESIKQYLDLIVSVFDSCSKLYYKHLPTNRNMEDIVREIKAVIKRLQLQIRINNNEIIPSKQIQQTSSKEQTQNPTNSNNLQEKNLQIQYQTVNSGPNEKKIWFGVSWTGYVGYSVSEFAQELIEPIFDRDGCILKVMDSLPLPDDPFSGLFKKKIAPTNRILDNGFYEWKIVSPVSDPPIIFQTRLPSHIQGSKIDNLHLRCGLFLVDNSNRFIMMSSQRMPLLIKYEYPRADLLFPFLPVYSSAEESVLDSFIRDSPQQTMVKPSINCRQFVNLGGHFFYWSFPKEKRINKGDDRVMLMVQCSDTGFIKARHLAIKNPSKSQ